MEEVSQGHEERKQMRKKWEVMGKERENETETGEKRMERVEGKREEAEDGRRETRKTKRR